MDPDTDKLDNFPFHEAIGSLNFAQTRTRPNISYALSATGQFAQHPGPIHCTAIRKVFRYLKGATDFGLSTPRLQSLINPSHTAM
jgi:hypothetical protein